MLDLSEEGYTVDQIADSEYGVDSARHQLIRAVSQARRLEIDLDADMRILSKLYGLTKPDGPAVGTASEFRTMLGESGLNEYELSTVLRHYGFSTRSIRREDGPRYRYELEQKAIADILELRSN